MKILSWNVNGLKSSLENDFGKNIKEIAPDIICIQETKLNRELKETFLDEYYKYYNYSNKPGYSGVAVFTKEQADNVILGMKIEDEFGEIEDLDDESRVLTVEFNNFFVVSVYVPCSQSNMDRQFYRNDFDENFIKYIQELNSKKDVVICGDFNVCHADIDICNLDKHKNIEVFSDVESSNFSELMELGLIDTYRYMHPQMRKYTFWTNDIEDRENSKFGWRLDYILVSEYLRKDIREANILTKINGSDHCPIELVIRT